MKLTIANTGIHQDAEGRYSLNDLHRASGGEEKHGPDRFMRLDSTQGLINAISNSPEMENYTPSITKTGRYGGTYACKEVVYAYAMWISPEFNLRVIRTFDQVTTGSLQKISTNATLTRSQVEAGKSLIKGYIEMLQPSKVTVAGILHRLEEKAGLQGLLPHYVSEGPDAETNGSEAPASATELLKRRNIECSAQAFNKMLHAAGFLEEKTRPSTKGTVKKFWSVTDFEYGKNESSPNNPRETQPLWYPSKFDELLALVMPVSKETT